MRRRVQPKETMGSLPSEKTLTTAEILGNQNDDEEQQQQQQQQQSSQGKTTFLSALQQTWSRRNQSLSPVERSRRIFLVGFLVIWIGLFGWRQYERQVASQWKQDSQVQELLLKAPKAWDDKYLVFCTQYNPHQDQLRVQMGQSTKSSQQAFQRACLWTTDAGRFPYTKIDVVTSIQREPSLRVLHDPVFSVTDMGEWGLTLDWTNPHAVFLPNQVVAQGIVDRRGHFRWDHLGLSMKQHLSRYWPRDNTQFDDDNVKSSGVAMDFFQTSSVFVDTSNHHAAATTTTVVPLVRGHRDFRNLTTQMLSDSIALAQDYLMRSVDPATGKIVYRYLPKSDTEPDEEELTRHAGTVYAMAVSLSTQTYNRRLQIKILAALKYLQELLVECPLGHTDQDPPPRAKCVVYTVAEGHQWTHLGVNSLTLLALAEFMRSLPTHAPEMEPLLQDALAIANWIVGMMDKSDGTWLAMEQTVDDGELHGQTTSRYYPGEALYALSKLVNVVEWHQNQRHKAMVDATPYSNAVTMGINALVSEQAAVPEEEFVNDHWAMYAVAEMSAWHAPQSNVDFAIRTVRIAADRQIGEGSEQWEQQPGTLGIYENQPGRADWSATATATKSEGLCAVYPLLAEERQNDPQLIESLYQTVVWGVQYQLQAQLRMEQAMYFKNPARIVGAFGRSVLDPSTRNDYTQHNLSSLLCLKRIMEIRQTVDSLQQDEKNNNNNNNNNKRLEREQEEIQQYE